MYYYKNLVCVKLNVKKNTNIFNCEEVEEKLKEHLVILKILYNLMLFVGVSCMAYLSTFHGVHKTVT